MPRPTYGCSMAMLLYAQGMEKDDGKVLKTPPTLGGTIPITHSTLTSNKVTVFLLSGLFTTLGAHNVINPVM